MDYLWAFLGGVLISFTPCVYPLIPITAGFISVKAGRDKLKAFILSFIYVTGIAITYSVLGLIASLSGKIFGRISAHPITFMFVGTIIILLGLSMLGLFKIPFLTIVKPENNKKAGYFSTLLLGLSSGLVMSPCVSPALGAILAYLATKKNIFYGMTLLLSFAYGMGALLILVGTFSAALINLPRLGRWMGYIKKVCALILIAMGIYFISSGIGKLAWAQAKEPAAEEKISAADFILEDLNQNTVTLSNYKDKKSVLLFFWTTWCPFCRQELRLLNDRYAELTKEGVELLAIDIGESRERVGAFVKNYNLTLRILLDRDETVAQNYGLVGVPTYYLINRKGGIVFQGHSLPDYKNLLK